MNWTKEKPKSPGHYWHRLNSHASPAIVELGVDGYVSRIGIEYDDRIEDVDGEFAGPIQAPADNMPSPYMLTKSHIESYTDVARAYADKKHPRFWVVLERNAIKPKQTDADNITPEQWVDKKWADWNDHLSMPDV